MVAKLECTRMNCKKKASHKLSPQSNIFYNTITFFYSFVLLNAYDTRCDISGPLKAYYNGLTSFSEYRINFIFRWWQYSIYL